MRGGSPSSPTLRGEAVDARGAPQTNACRADGEVVWSWRPDAGVKLAMMLRITLMMVARKPGHQGELEVSCKPPRRESRVDPVEPVVLPPCFLLHGTHGCNRRPAFPAPSSLREGQRRCKIRAPCAAEMLNLAFM